MENPTVQKSDTTAEKTCCAPSGCGGDKATAKTETIKINEAVRETVKERYGQAVTAVMKGSKPSCCGSSAAPGIGGTDPITRNLYDAEQAGGVPEDALLASFGCGKAPGWGRCARLRA